MSFLKNLLAKVVASVKNLWATEPSRVTAVAVAVLVFVFAKLGVVVDETTILGALAYILPVLLGGEVIRSQVTPVGK